MFNISNLYFTISTFLLAYYNSLQSILYPTQCIKAHQADIDSLVRLANCGNIIVCSNPTSAMSMMHTFKCALEKGNRGMIPSFFKTLESPAVGEYKHQQELALKSVVAGKKTDADDVAPQANEPNPAEPIGRRASALLGTNMSFHEDCRFDEDSSYNDIDEDEDQDESRDDFAMGTFSRAKHQSSTSTLLGLAVKGKKKNRGVLKVLGEKATKTLRRSTVVLEPLRTSLGKKPPTMFSKSHSS